MLLCEHRAGWLSDLTRRQPDKVPCCTFVLFSAFALFGDFVGKRIACAQRRVCSVFYGIAARDFGAVAMAFSLGVHAYVAL